MHAAAQWQAARLRAEARRQPPVASAPAPDDAPVAVAPDPGVLRRGTRATLLAFLLVTALHVWIISAGGMTPLPSYSAYYDRLAQGFLHGQTSLTLIPAPAHLALPDPYDPAANREFRKRPGVHDAVLFNGKFYLYWGPVPALLMAPVKAATGWRGFGDEYLVLAFAVGTTLLTALTLRRVWGRFFADQPAWTLLLATLVAGVATPLGYTLARPAVYEAAILGGQFFLMAGLYLLLLGTPQERKRHGDKETRRQGDKERDPSVSLSPCLPVSLSLSSSRLALIGSCWSLAVGSRVSLAVAVIALAVMVARRVLAEGRRPGGGITIKRLGAFALPLVVGAVSLSAYNYARFGSPWQFGQRYQLTSANYKATPALFSLGNLWPGLYSYTLRPVQVMRHFPFLEAAGGEGTFPPFIRLPKHYEFNEPIAGLLLVTPFLWLAVMPALGAMRTGQRDREERRVVRYFLAASLLGFAPVLFMLGSTMRYLVDLTPCLMVVAAIGMWQRGRALRERPGARRRFTGVVIVLAGYSVVVGLLLSFTGYYDHFYSFNREWFGRLSYRTGSPAWYRAGQNSSPPVAASEPEQRHAGDRDNTRR